MTSYPKYPYSVHSRQVPALQLAGLALVAIALSLASAFLAMQDWVDVGAPQQFVQPSVELGAQDIEGWREAWSAAGENARLMIAPEGEKRWVCPYIAGRARQPLCRRFVSDLLGVCRDGSHYQLVLANGDIHLVDQVLLGTDGSFTPVHRPEQPLSLRLAWIPTSDCYPEAGSADTLAVDQDSNLMHYDGQGWRKIDQVQLVNRAFEVID